MQREEPHRFEFVLGDYFTFYTDLSEQTLAFFYPELQPNSESLGGSRYQ